ncbi:MAG: helix-turn-helix transcriptional regulator [Desulfobacteraceae bacterium]|nr:helix-turn-helix transcriptional regulator [Desulfobacteraceae bacterium]
MTLETKVLELQTGTLETRTLDVGGPAGSGGIQLTRLNRDITLTIMDCTLHKPVSVQFEPPFESLSFGFSLAGQMEVRPEGSGDVLTYKPGQTDLNTNPGESRIEETLGPGRMVRVCLTMTHEVLEGLARWEINSMPALLIKRSCDPAHFRGRLTPSMRSVIARIIQCPFQGGTRDLFLEGKALELLAHKLELLDSPLFRPDASVKPQDLDRIHHAAELLTANLETAPGLEELAKTVGMCRSRLHECFCTVHGLTPFEYLQQHRLEKAMTYLLEGRMNVTEAAFAVGYSSSGYFSKVFKKRFGDPPGKFVVKTGFSDLGMPKKIRR